WVGSGNIDSGVRQDLVDTPQQRSEEEGVADAAVDSTHEHAGDLIGAELSGCGARTRHARKHASHELPRIAAQGLERIANTQCHSAQPANPSSRRWCPRRRSLIRLTNAKASSIPCLRARRAGGAAGYSQLGPGISIRKPVGNVARAAAAPRASPLHGVPSAVGAATISSLCDAEYLTLHRGCR